DAARKARQRCVPNGHVDRIGEPVLETVLGSKRRPRPEQVLHILGRQEALEIQLLPPRRDAHRQLLGDGNPTLETRRLCRSITGCHAQQSDTEHVCCELPHCASPLLMRDISCCAHRYSSWRSWLDMILFLGMRRLGSLEESRSMMREIVSPTERCCRSS